MEELDLTDVKRTPRTRGLCSICGKNAKRTFEHTPPRSAFNDKPVRVTTLAELEAADFDASKAEGTIQIEGMGYAGLCDPCNNLCEHYVPLFKTWVQRGRDAWNQVDWANADASVEEKGASILIKQVRPLPVIKEIIAMFLTINGEADPEFRKDNQELVDFVLNEDRVGLSDRYRLYSALFTGPVVKFAPLHVLQKDGQQYLLSVIDYPPFSYALTIGTPADGMHLAELTDFANFNIDETADIDRTFKVAFGHTEMPLDYRSTAKIAADKAAGIEQKYVAIDSVKSDGTGILRKKE